MSAIYQSPARARVHSDLNADTPPAHTTKGKAMTHFRRTVAAIAGLVASVAGLVVAAPAAFAMRVNPADGGRQPSHPHRRYPCRDGRMGDRPDHHGRGISNRPGDDRPQASPPSQPPRPSGQLTATSAAPERTLLVPLRALRANPTNVPKLAPDPNHLKAHTQRHPTRKRHPNASVPDPGLPAPPASPSSRHRRTAPDHPRHPTTSSPPTLRPQRPHQPLDAAEATDPRRTPLNKSPSAPARSRSDPRPERRVPDQIVGGTTTTL